jgi:Flp pilus assembly protein TadD/membrane protease YdiL (CAAX protease family)
MLCAAAYACAQTLADEQKRNRIANAKEHYTTGRCLEEEEKYEEATREFQLAISIASDDSLYYDNLAFCLQKLGRYDEAIQVINQVLSLNPKDSYAYRQLGICYYHQQKFGEATKALQQALSLDPSDADSAFWLGYAFYADRKYDAAIGALDEALKITPNDFDANYWRGASLLRVRRFEEASRSFGKAVEIRPSDFDANFSLGISFLGGSKFQEAIASFEKARKIRPQDSACRFELFACYLATQQFQKAVRIFPFLVGALGGAFLLSYVVGFALLLPFSLRIRSAAFPGFIFSFAWLVVFSVRQIAFFVLFLLFPGLGSNESVFAGTMVAGLPIIIVAAAGFARQPWGGPFQWPLRFGTWKIAAISFAVLVLLWSISTAFSHVYVQVMHKPPPVQHSVPLIQKALQTNPMIAWLAIPAVIPVMEEIFFRGLFYGAFEKRWGIKGAILGSGFMFACVHLQLIGFFYLFCVGLILAWARWRCGSLGLPIVIHGLNNAVVLLVLTFFPATQ